MFSIRPRKWLFAAGVLLLGGLARLPLEHRFSATLHEHRLAEEKLNLSLRDELGQSFFIAVLGGFRSLVASLVEIDNIQAWQDQNFAKVDAAYALCTRLQPRVWHYWDWRAWMKTHNAYDHYKYEDMSRPGLQPWIRQNLIDDGIAILKEGMKHLPDDFRLPRAIAWLMADFEKNQHASYYEASQWFYRAWQLRPHYRHLYRFHVYHLAQAPGHELEAWPLLLEMYHSGPIKSGNSDHTPSGETHLVRLLPKVQAMLPDAALPPELAARAPAILAADQERREAVERRLERERAQEEEVQEAILKMKR